MIRPTKGNLFDPKCPTRVILNHVTGRWSSLVLAMLLDEEMLRFSELRRNIGGVSEKMLAQTLRVLEEDGFVDRRSLPVVPPHVEYRLTPLGKEVATHVSALGLWVRDNLGRVMKAREQRARKKAA